MAPTHPDGRRTRSFDLPPMLAVHTSIKDVSELLKTDALFSVCLVLLSTCALGFILTFLRGILIPFAVAVFLMYLLQPIVNYLSKPPRRWCDKCCGRRGEMCCEGFFAITRSRRYSDVGLDVDEETSQRMHLQQRDSLMPPRKKGCADRPFIPRWLAVIMAISAAVVLLGLVGSILYGSVIKLEKSIPKYERGAQQVSQTLKRYLAVLHFSLDDDLVPFLVLKFRELTPHAVSLVLGTMGHAIYVVIFLIYLLISPARPIPSGVWGQIDLHIRRYIRLKTAVCLGAGVSVGVTLFLLGIPLAYVFGLVTFIFNFIPNIGPLSATLLPMPVAIFDPDLTLSVKILTFVIPSVIHLVIGSFVEPRVFGESFELSPVVVLLSLTFWGSLWGVPGMVLAVPMIVMLRIVCLHLGEHPFAATVVALLAGKYFEKYEQWEEEAESRSRAESMVGVNVGNDPTTFDGQIGGGGPVLQQPQPPRRQKSSGRRGMGGGTSPGGGQTQRDQQLLIQQQQQQKHGGGEYGSV